MRWRVFREKVGFANTGVVNETTWRYLFGYKMYPINISGTPYASVCVTNSTLTEAQMDSNAEYVYKFLTKQGFTKQAACGVLGNMQKESGINPGIWQENNNLTKGYGLVQWTPATNFLTWAVDAAIITSATVSAANGLTNSDAATLMKAELNCLMWNCSNRDVFSAPTDGGHTGYKMTFSQYKESTLDAGTLAKVFHDHFERSKDNAQQIAERVEFANKWYNKL